MRVHSVSVGALTAGLYLHVLGADMSQGPLPAGVMQTFALFFSVKRFQASVSSCVSVGVCTQLPELKLTLMQMEPLAVSEGGPGPGPGLEPAAGPGIDGTPSQRDWAYVLHTSGTTGPPKTVRVPHECILPNILHLRWVSCGLGGLGLLGSCSEVQSGLCSGLCFRSALTTCCFWRLP